MVTPIRQRTEILADPIAAWDELEAGITFLEEEINAKYPAYVVTPFVAGTRTSTWVMTKSEIQALEDRMHAVSVFLKIPHLRTVWSGLMPVGYNALNHFILGLAPQEWIDAGFDFGGDLGALMPINYSLPGIDWIGIFRGLVPIKPLIDLILDSLPVVTKYLYASGYATQKVFKISPDLTKISESADYGGEIRALASDGTYIYAAGVTTNKIYKYDPADMSKVAESTSYGGWINKLVVLGDHIYAAGNTTRKVYKYRLSDLAKEAESISYGNDLTLLCTDGAHIFAGGWYSSTYPRQICKFSSDTLTLMTASASLSSSGLEGLASDGSFVYVSAGTGIYKLAASDLTQFGVDYGSGSSVKAIALGGGYLYAANTENYKLRKVDVSNMTEVDSYPTPNTVNALAIIDGFIYLSGADVDGQGTSVIRVATATMEKGTGACEYGGVIDALIIA